MVEVQFEFGLTGCLLKCRLLKWRKQFEFGLTGRLLRCGLLEWWRCDSSSDLPVVSSSAGYSSASMGVADACISAGASGAGGRAIFPTVCTLVSFIH